ncbi:aspartate kinase [Listeria cossartiae subsp. cayugensis]|uniref:Aspartokinase n=1 Tax=Listeria cossartiae subsp. cayugensis TaxID=2713505 RepID=A0A7X0ZBW6_9LIST|nr:aspartate kinase [Listeria cossartiae]MBC2249505.1 aspartate kinase [Listeria cossartiae subsp. cayugensis]MDT0003058.1 aspartate kinase [Listeria cossartiae subsp. cayugensis]MDT0018574.1 aspartate kinase [Listeria cossartiae subsp. cayugensis]MDT0035853.1 aspartate kinase [Listeria cossartiae subsp. cayugensis]MDT0040324.1 aspartate kinase [Listeria cossartiae subsp. cayugensis]
MKIIVQKFGGTSVQNEKSRLMAFNHIKHALKEGYKVVVVVSAIGRYGDPYATDTLLELIGAKNTKLTAREQDTLLSVGETISASVFTNMLKEANIKAEAFSGGQAGIITSDDHLNAKITEVDTTRLKNALLSLDVAVVAGFQGMTDNGDISTLGRGGSDTSAAALGVSLQADYIDIFTDVDGMMTADPRIVEHARSLPRVSYNEVSNMAYQGAKVIHPRAVEIAMTAKIPMRIRSTYLESTGTLVTSLADDSGHFDVKERMVTGVAHVTNLTQISVQTETVKAQQLAFKILADAGISLDFINISTQSVIFTVPEEKCSIVTQLLEDANMQTTVREACAKVSIVGAGITGVPGVTARIVGALSEKNIPILQSADSHTTIWVLVREEDLISAVNALHDVFCLEIK